MLISLLNLARTHRLTALAFTELHEPDETLEYVFLEEFMLITARQAGVLLRADGQLAHRAAGSIARLIAGGHGLAIRLRLHGRYITLIAVYWKASDAGTRDV